MKGKPPHDATDEQLVEIAARDPGGASGQQAASELFERHERRVYLWCFRFVRDHERAVDLAQETLLSAYRALGSFRGRSRFSTWLFVIARNCCLKAVRAPALLRDEEVIMEELPHPHDSPEAEVIGWDEEERLRELVMERLDEAERKALWLRCFERMPVDEIGRAMKLENLTGARALLQRARRKLRAALEQGGAEVRP